MNNLAYDINTNMLISEEPFSRLLDCNMAIFYLDTTAPHFEEYSILRKYIESFI